MKMLLTALMIIFFVTPSVAKTTEFGYRPGGYVFLFIAQAHNMLGRGDRIVITDDQLSAAAIQVVWYHRHGGKVCAKKGTRLFFHMGVDTITGQPRDANRHYLGRSVPEGWYSPSKFGIALCQTK